MFRLRSIAATLMLAPLPVLAVPLSIDASQQESVSVSLYNNDLGLIRDVRKLPAISPGHSLSIEDVSHRMMSETLRLENAGEVLEQNLNTNLISNQALLQHYIGQQVELARSNPASGAESRIPVTLLSHQGNLAMVDNNGQIETIPLDNGQWRFIFPEIPAGMQARPSLEVALQNSRSGASAVLTYLTRGLNWQMDYTMTLNKQGNRLSIDGLATLNNQTGVDYKNASIQLIAGQVNQPDNGMRFKQERAVMAMAMADGSASGQPQQLQDYQLYKLPRKTHLRTGQTKQVNLISAGKVNTAKTYRYSFPVYAGLDHNQYREKPATELSFTNNKSSDLGFPLPAGNARVFSPDNDNQLQFIGAAQIQPTPAGQQVKLPIGKAFDISIERRQTNFKKVFNGYSVSQQLSVSNSRNTPVTLTIEADFNQDWKIDASSQQFTKPSAGQARWQLKIPANGSQQLQFSAQLLQP